MTNDVPLITRRAVVRCGLWAIATAGVGARAAVSAASIPGASARKFPVFDALLFRGKPDLRGLGLEPMAPVANIWRPGGSKDDLDPVGLKVALGQLPRGTTTMFVDVEQWQLVNVEPAVRERSANHYLSTAQIVRETLPDVRFGFYGVAPSCVYWPIVSNQSAGLDQWHAANHAMLPVGDYVDFVLPSLYTYYDDPQGWAKFANATIAEARMYDRPVYPFLWNEYFDGNLLLRGKEVKTDAWNAELELCVAKADGAVLWGGSEENWDPAQAWWQSVKALLRRTAPR